MRRLDSLDGLRAFAVLLVFASHVDQPQIVGGFTGVETFFVLSGYLITMLLLRERRRNGMVSLRNFYMRRVLRLYPALIVLVLVVTPIAFYDHIGRPPLDSLAAITYLSNIWSNYSANVSLTLHTWSLSVEEQFYVVWPAVLVYAIARNKRPSVILVVSIVASIFLSAAVFNIPRLLAPQFLPFPHIPAIGGGALLAIATEHTTSASLRKATRFGVVPALALIAVTVLVPERWWTAPLVAVVAWFACAHVIVHGDSLMSRAFGSTPAVWLGRRSYGFYLWHYPIIFLLARSFGPAGKALIGLPLTLIATIVSWHFIELRFLRRKARYEPSAVNVPAPQPAT
jgi:peptidoglycan/LPS O-acetylase OafA/YrhL